MKKNVIRNIIVAIAVIVVAIGIGILIYSYRIKSMSYSGEYIDCSNPGGKVEVWIEGLHVVVSEHNYSSALDTSSYTENYVIKISVLDKFLFLQAVKKSDYACEMMAIYAGGDKVYAEQSMVSEILWNDQFKDDDLDHNGKVTHKEMAIGWWIEMIKGE